MIRVRVRIVGIDTDPFAVRLISSAARELGAQCRVVAESSDFVVANGRVPAPSASTPFEIAVVALTSNGAVNRLLRWIHQIRATQPGVIILAAILAKGDIISSLAPLVRAGLDDCALLEHGEMVTALRRCVTRAEHGHFPSAYAADLLALIEDRAARDLVRQLVEEGPRCKVADWANLAGLARRTLYRRLIASAGLTPAEVISWVRLHRATELGTDSRISVREIAFRSGFPSAQALRAKAQTLLNHPASVLRSTKSRALVLDLLRQRLQPEWCAE